MKTYLENKYILAFAISVMLLSCLFGKTLVAANEREAEPNLCRYYTSIQIEAGDTLWSIAETYNNSSVMDIRAYIDELRKTNHLHTDSIKAGDSLVILYFGQLPIT